MPITIPTWRSFQTLSSPTEAASASACCNFSLGTLEVSCRDPGMASFALTERKRPHSWRWAIVDIQGSVLGTGCEPTQARAKTIAGLALQMCAIPTTTAATND